MNFTIIEDEQDGRLFLQEIMLRYFEDWKLLGVGSSVSEGIEIISKLKPELVFLDVEIGEGTGFDVLNAFSKPNFHVIFITAHEHYAIKAIKYAALDYLLKPISVDQLAEALSKVKKLPNTDKRHEILKANLSQAMSPDNIMIHTNKGYSVVPVDSITHIEANGQYVFVHIVGKYKILASRSLGYYEELLAERHFYRIHKSFLVNVSKVNRIITQPIPQVQLIDHTLIDLAFRRKDAFVSYLKTVNAH